MASTQPSSVENVIVARDKVPVEERIIEVRKVVEQIKYVPKIVEKIVEKPKVEIVEKIVEVPKIEYRERVIEVQKPCCCACMPCCRPKGGAVKGVSVPEPARALKK